MTAWKKIFIQIQGGAEQIESPFDSSVYIDHWYIMLDADSRLGYLLIWCPATNKGVHVSRVKVPINNKKIAMLEEVENGVIVLPEFELQDFEK